jgi:hypothetical protein|tara:strand:+ start:97 stop:585 length:489 start_codon:yes stop_codon:yes gene_type:complete
MSEEKSKLAKLKKNYLEIQTKHGLPSFEDLNKDFHIEKIAELETELLIREVRRLVGDKMVSYMRFVENLLNPVNVPMFILSIVKALNSEDKKKLSEMYKDLMKMEIVFIELDLEFSEDKESEFIKDSYKSWQGIKKDLLGILGNVKVWKKTKVDSNNKGYFG